MTSQPGYARKLSTAHMTTDQRISSNLQQHITHTERERKRERERERERERDGWSVVRLVGGSFWP
jgi:hypothetical protein